jgi:GAF domain-containing protein/sugar diacid utilization regulator
VTTTRPRADTESGLDPANAMAVRDAVRREGLSRVAARRLEQTLGSIVANGLEGADRRRSAQVERLLATAERVTRSLDLETVLTAIVEDARVLLGADSGDVLLWDKERDRLRVVAVSQRPKDLLGFEMRYGEGLSTQAIVQRRTIWVDDYRTSPHRCRALDRYVFGSVICSPLIFRGDAIGALNLHATGGRRFGQADAAVLGAFAGHAALAIDHARRFENEVRLSRDLAEANAELNRSLSVQQQLAEQVLLDSGPAGIADVLAANLGRRVVIQDHIRRVIAGASPDGGDDWRDLVNEDAAAEPLSMPVRVGRDVAGHLLLSAAEDLGPIDRALVDVAVTGVALEFAKIRATLEVEDRLRGEAIADLLSGSFPSDAAMAARAARLGHDLGRPHDLLVIDVEPSDELDEVQLIAVVRERLAAQTPRSVAVSVAGALVVLARRSGSRGRGSRGLADDLISSIEAVSGPGTVTIAVGGPCERPAEYASAYTASREALDVMLKLGRRGTVIGDRELGPYGLLLQASSRDDLEAFARTTLAPILEHDRRHRTELASTLRIYLEEDRVQRRAATRTYTHVNTVAYRVGRIEQLLGRSLADPSTVFDLTLAFRILDVVDGR